MADLSVTVQIALAVRRGLVRGKLAHVGLSKDQLLFAECFYTRYLLLLLFTYRARAGFYHRISLPVPEAEALLAKVWERLSGLCVRGTAGMVESGLSYAEAEALTLCSQRTLQRAVAVGRIRTHTGEGNRRLLGFRDTVRTALGDRQLPAKDAGSAEQAVLWRLLFLRYGHDEIPSSLPQSGAKRLARLTEVLPVVAVPIPRRLRALMGELEPWQLRLLQGCFLAHFHATAFVTRASSDRSKLMAQVSQSGGGPAGAAALWRALMPDVVCAECGWSGRFPAADRPAVGKWERRRVEPRPSVWAPSKEEELESRTLARSGTHRVSAATTLECPRCKSKFPMSPTGLADLADSAAGSFAALQASLRGSEALSADVHTRVVRHQRLAYRRRAGDFATTGVVQVAHVLEGRSVASVANSLRRTHDQLGHGDRAQGRNLWFWRYVNAVWYVHLLLHQLGLVSCRYVASDLVGPFVDAFLEKYLSAEFTPLDLEKWSAEALMEETAKWWADLRAKAEPPPKMRGP